MTEEEILDVIKKISKLEKYLGQTKENLHNLSSIASELLINKRIKAKLGLDVGDFFEDLSGDIGVFLGCGSHGKNLYGTLLNKEHSGYVYPEKKLNYKQAMKKIANKTLGEKE